jgi:hypothetical protein
VGQVYRFTDENGQVRLFAEIDPPLVAPATPMTTTAIANSITGSGDYTVNLTATTDGTPALAFGVAGDAFPRVIIPFDTRDSDILLGDGTADPAGPTLAGMGILAKQSDNTFALNLFGGGQALNVGKLDANSGNRDYAAETTGAIGFGPASPGRQWACQLSAGSGAPAIGGEVGDLYIRIDGTETTYFYRCTVAGAAGVATWAAMGGA